MLTTYAAATAINGYALGLRLPIRTGPRLKLHWRGNAPPPSPAVVDHLSGWGWEMGANNRYGTCGPTSASNHADLTGHFLAGREFNAPLDDIFELYRHSGSPNFDPRTGRGDNGVTMDQLAEALVRYGLSGRKALGAAQLEDASDASIQAAIARFGGVLMAVNLETAQSRQTDAGLWDYSPSGEWGGHAILAGAYDRDKGQIDVITWQKRVGTTQRFRRYQADSYWVVLWPELLNSGKLFDPSVDYNQLAADYQALTGNPFPVPVPPSPSPAPPPVPPAPPGPVTETQICLYPDTREYRVPPGWKARP